MFVKGETTCQLTIERSVFIAYLKRIDNIQEYNVFLNAIRKKHYDANHHCSALLLKDAKRSSDDGEPAGSAGLPILSSLEKSGLENAGCVVVRYFGGIKLGIGGLIRAYSQATAKAIESADLQTAEQVGEYLLKVPYDLSGKIDRFLRTNTQIYDITYDLEVTYRFFAKDDPTQKIVEITKGIAPIFIKNTEVMKDVIK